MSQKVTFTASINDGGNGQSQTFTLADLEIDESWHPSIIEDAIAEAYDNWYNGLNMGGWGYDDN